MANQKTAEPTVIADVRDSSPSRIPGLPAGIALSPSRAGDFLACPLLFRFRSIDRFPQKPSAAAARGTLVHAVLERLFDLPAPERSLSNASELVAQTWRDLASEDPRLWYALRPDDDFDPDRYPDDVSADEVEAWVNSTSPLLRTYFKLEDPTTFEPLAREMWVEVGLNDGLNLRGIVDRVDVSHQGDVRIVDYKTGRAPGVGFEQRAMFQMRFYALMVFRRDGRLPRRLQLMYLGDGQVLHYDPSETDLDAFEKKLRAIWTAIVAVAETGDWQPRESKMCSWCDHHALCPAKGGVTPPLPEHVAVGTRLPLTLRT